MPSKTVKLSHRQNQIDHKSSAEAKINADAVPTLFLHGLDSSSHTWRDTLDELSTPAVALDLRGCGYSDLGDADDFCPELIVEDIHEFISKHEYFQGVDVNVNVNEDKGGQKKGIKKFVICGHSMVRTDNMI